MSLKDVFDLTGRVAIVTGGNGGLGRGMVLGLAEAGASIVIAARNPEKNARTKKEIAALSVPVEAYEVDVTSEQQVNDMVEKVMQRFGRIDVLINNAGTNKRKRPEEYTLEEWRFLVDTNLTSAFLCAKAVYPHMKAGGGGKVINIGSMFSIFGGDVVSVYGATKGGMVQLTKSWSAAWAQDNIQVNVILPGWIHTDLTAGFRRNFPERYNAVLARIPAGRWGEPEDLKGLAVFLASKASDYVTGASFAIDGGYSISGF